MVLSLLQSNFEAFAGGGYEAIQRHAGRYAAATEMRKDGTALAY